MFTNFKNRTEAGKELAKALIQYKNRGDVLLFALPRGGVPVANEVAKALDLPLDVWIVRKLGVPGQKELAIDDFNRAIKWNLDYFLAYNSRGFAHSSVGKYELTIADFTKTIELKPNFATAHANRGLAYSKIGEQERAIQDFSMAIELNPRHILAYNYRGLVYRSKGEHELAILDFGIALQLALSSGNEELTKEIQANLELSKAKK